MEKLNGISGFKMSVYLMAVRKAFTLVSGWLVRCCVYGRVVFVLPVRGVEVEYRGLRESGPQKISKRNLLREKYCQINFICCRDITLSARMGCGCGTNGGWGRSRKREGELAWYRRCL